MRARDASGDAARFLDHLPQVGYVTLGLRVDRERAFELACAVVHGRVVAAAALAVEGALLLPFVVLPILVLGWVGYADVRNSAAEERLGAATALE